MSSDNLLVAQNQMAKPTTIWLLFLGWSYGSLEQVGKQILFYVTFGGFGIWTLVRLFTLSGAIREYNRKKCIQLGLSNEEMGKLGVY